MYSMKLGIMFWQSAVVPTGQQSHADELAIFEISLKDILLGLFGSCFAEMDASLEAKYSSSNMDTVFLRLGDVLKTLGTSGRLPKSLSKGLTPDGRSFYWVFEKQKFRSTKYKQFGSKNKFN